VRVRERQGALLGVHVLDLGRTAAHAHRDNPTQDQASRASPVPHLRAGHFPRVRVGPRDRFRYVALRYRGCWHGEMVEAGAGPHVLVALAWLAVLASSLRLVSRVEGRLSQQFAPPGQPAYETNQRILRAYGNGGPDLGPGITATLARALPAQAGWTVRVTGLDELELGGNTSGPAVLGETLLGALGALGVLAFVFGSLLALVPLLVAATAILTTFLLVLGLSELTDVSVFVEYLVALIGLGVAIDYSPLLVTRWREELAGGQRGDQAVARAMATAGRAVVFSGVTVAVGLVSMVVLPVPFLRSMGSAGMLIPLISVLVSVLVTLTLLPVLLAGVGRAGGLAPPPPAAARRPRLGSACRHRPPAPTTTVTRPLGHRCRTARPSTCSGHRHHEPSAHSKRGASSDAHRRGVGTAAGRGHGQRAAGRREPRPVDQATAHYNTIRLHAGIGYVTPDDEHSGRGAQIRKARRQGLKWARRRRIAYHRKHGKETRP
jgi:MMPL family